MFMTKLNDFIWQYYQKLCIFRSHKKSDVKCAVCFLNIWKYSCLSQLFKLVIKKVNVTIISDIWWCLMFMIKNIIFIYWNCHLSTFMTATFMFVTKYAQVFVDLFVKIVVVSNHFQLYKGMHLIFELEIRKQICSQFEGFRSTYSP